MDKGHGRSERRALRTTRLLTLGHRWAGLKQGFELTRERTVRGAKTVEVVYGITSLSPDRADAGTLLIHGPGDVVYFGRRPVSSDRTRSRTVWK